MKIKGSLIGKKENFFGNGKWLKEINGRMTIITIIANIYKVAEYNRIAKSFRVCL